MGVFPIVLECMGVFPIVLVCMGVFPIYRKSMKLYVGRMDACNGGLMCSEYKEQADYLLEALDYLLTECWLHDSSYSAIGTPYLPVDCLDV